MYRPRTRAAALFLAILLWLPLPLSAEDDPDGHPLDATVWAAAGGTHPWVAYYDSTAARMRGYWQADDKMFLDVTVGHSDLDIPGTLRLFGEYLMVAPGRPECPDSAEVWSEFEGTLSADGQEIRGRFRMPRLNRQTCEIDFPGNWLDLAWQPFTAPDTGPCLPPAGLRAALDGLEQDWLDATRRRPDLPGQAMFRRTGLDATEAADQAGVRQLVDSQIAHAGPDDWLVAAGGEGGAIRLFLAEVAPFMDGERCEPADWQALVDRLGDLRRQLTNRRAHVHNTFTAIEANYITWGQEIQGAIDETRSDHSLILQALEALGWSNADTVENTQLLNVLSVLRSYLEFRAGVAPGPVAGPVQLLVNVWKSFAAATDLGALMRAEGMLPFFLETAEQHAWLQPLDDQYTDLAEDQRIIIDLVRQHRPERQDD